jgi:hypothetical protein
MQNAEFFIHHSDFWSLMEKIIEVTSCGVTAALIVRSATVGDSLRRGMFYQSAINAPLPDPVDQTAALTFFLRCMACLVEGKINDADAKSLTHERFVNLPSEIGNAWLEAVLEVNPHWDFSAAKETADPKKESTS